MFIFYKFHIDLCLLIISLSIVTIFKLFLLVIKWSTQIVRIRGTRVIFFKKRRKAIEFRAT